MSEPQESTPSTPPVAETEVFEGETFYIDGALREQLLAMGYSQTAVDKSIMSGCINLDTCLAWLGMHQGMPELEDPLPSNVRVLVKEKRILTAEEREEAVRKFREKAKAMKEMEALSIQQRAVEAAKAQRDALKGIREQQALADAQKRDRIQEEERLRKQRDAAARENVQLQLKVDRWVRMGKSREEALKLATEEIQKAKAAVRQTPRQVDAAPQMEQRQAPSTEWALNRVLGDAPAAPDEVAIDEKEPPTLQNFRLRRQKFSSSEGIAVLDRVLSNIVEDPFSLKLRKIRLDSVVLSRHVLSMPGALAFLQLCGFQRSEGMLVMNVVIIRRLRLALQALRE